MEQKTYKVIKAHINTFPDPLKIKIGQSLTIIPKESEYPGWIWCVDRDGKDGWVPASYVKQYGDYGIALFDYDATELSVQIGEELTILKEESGWLWCRRQTGKLGWVPKENLQIAE